jgi:oligosaccharide repeat unit polymerase
MLRTAHGSLEEGLFREVKGLTRGVACFWLVASSFFFGIVVLWSGQSSYLPYFVPAAYAAMFFSVGTSVRAWRDPFNPLCLILVVGFVRFFLPGILLLSGVEPANEAGLFFHLMTLSDDDWAWGHALALLGVLGIVLGWLATQPGSNPGVSLKFHIPGGVRYASWAGMLIGFLALLAFVLMNASLGVIASGGFRETTIQEGTGKYFFLTYLLIAGSVLISCDFLSRGRKSLSLLPITVAAMLYWILGGRGRAMFSLAVGLLMLWYFTGEKRSWRKLPIRPVSILIASVIAVIVVWLSYVGSLYRGGLGSRAFIEGWSLAGLWAYLQGNIFTDLGQLHSLAGAIVIGPGVLNGDTFYGSLTWPLSAFLPIPGRSAGVFIVETLVGFGKGERWGLNASLIGDAYLNFGLTGVVLVMLLSGALLKILYVKFRHGSLHIAIYAIALFSALQICFLSIEKWPQALVTLAFTYFLILIGNIIFRVPVVDRSGPSSKKKVLN